jgi:mycothiol synthase
MSASLMEGYAGRAASLEDLESIVELVNDYWESLIGTRKFTLDDARTALTVPGFDIHASTRVVVAPDGQFVGFAMVRDLYSPPVHPDVLGCVHSDYEGTGIGSHLLAWAEERALLAIPRVPDGVRVAMQLTTSVDHVPTVRLCEALGLNAVRYHFLMAIDLDDAQPEPQWPDGIAIQTFQDHPDLEGLHRALHDAFRDHWGHVAPEDEGSALARLQYRIENDETFDPTLWFLALDGKEIAGVEMCDPYAGADRDMGIVSTLGVRRPWRRRGIGIALLYHAFGELQRRGRKRVSLGVDADSLTGATRLYERAGMHVDRKLVTYEKELRAGQELGTESVGDGEENLKATFYDKKGRPAAYRDGSTVFLFSGEPLAYFSGKSLYSYSGRHLGRLEQGWLRDNDGACMLFTKSAKGGPELPKKQREPARAPTYPIPVKVKRDSKPSKPESKERWSKLSVERFFNA